MYDLGRLAQLMGRTSSANPFPPVPPLLFAPRCDVSKPRAARVRRHGNGRRDAHVSDTRNPSNTAVTLFSRFKV